MNQSENRPRIEISTLLPLGVGVASLIGICLLLIVSRMAVARSTVEVPDTATPFHYLLIGTEPGISTAIPPTEEGVPGENFDPGSPGSSPDLSMTVTPGRGFSITAQSGVSSNNNSSNSTQRVPTNLSTDNPVVIIPGTQRPTLTVGAPLPTRTPTATFVPTPTSTSFDPKTPVTMLTLLAGSRTPSPTATATLIPTSISGPPLNPGTYDDFDSHLIYNGIWTTQTNVGNAYQNTLHVSSTINNTITFNFIGQELRLFYISGASLGTIRISIDQRSFDLNQASDVTSPSEWVSDFYPGAGTHNVTIRHTAGGSVNLDQIIIPDIIPTATTGP